MELVKLIRSGHDEMTVMVWGVAMMARRRAGETELKFDEALLMPLRDVMELVDTGSDPLENLT
jgi:hypothetical protein